MSSDSWAVRELADHLRGSDGATVPSQAPKLTGYHLLLVESLDRALEMVGRSGREVLYGMLELRYGLQREDIVSKPGVYVSALRDMLGSSCDVVEKYVLSQVRDQTGIDAHTLEEAVFRLKSTQTGV